MHVNDLDIPANKLTEPARHVMDRAVDDLRRRDHSLLTTAHLFSAIAQADWDLVARAMNLAAVNPQQVFRAIDAHLVDVPACQSDDLRVCPTTKLVCKLALLHAARAGRPGVDTADLLVALFEEPSGFPASLLRRSGVHVAVVVSQLEAYIAERELRMERFKKRLDLPPFLKQVATNLNLLACLDKLPPVFCRSGDSAGARDSEPP